MKKTLITLLLTLVTSICFSQNYAEAYSITIGTRKNANYKFDWRESEKVSPPILVYFNDKDVTIYSKEIQYYQTLLPQHETGEHGFYWNSIDKNMNRCKLYFFTTNPNIVAIEYDDFCIMYEIIVKD